MWFHGSVVFSQHNMGDMDMGSMGSSCLQHCLDAVRASDADDGLVVVGLSVPDIKPHAQVLQTSYVWSPSIDSHHDPSRILTTIKRE
jgi:hypothetical protein